jgi:AmmeMemoRadiSam system protein B
MRVRKRSLPPGWYPEGAEEALREIQGMLSSASAASTPEAPARAGVMPHAGWYFSGRLALEVLSSLARGIDTIVIIGGHLRSTDRIVCCPEDAYDTPFGEIRVDVPLREALSSSMDMLEDRERDNTVEIQLPFLRYLAPKAMALGMRAPPSSPAVALGEAVARTAAALGRRVAVAGSTDLTHYGGNYGFSPAGVGDTALRWVREVNDRRIVECMLALDIDGALERAARERSACSIGGAAAAMSFARATGARSGRLLGYMTSHDIRPDESFVGYAGIIYS